MNTKQWKRRYKERPCLVRTDNRPDQFGWASNGWNHQPEMMEAARIAIRSGNDHAEVIANLERAGFEVIPFKYMKEQLEFLGIIPKETK
jgi:hypothetical protein